MTPAKLTIIATIPKIAAAAKEYVVSETIKEMPTAVPIIAVTNEPTGELLLIRARTGLIFSPFNKHIAKSKRLIPDEIQATVMND